MCRFKKLKSVTSGFQWDFLHLNFGPWFLCSSSWQDLPCCVFWHPSYPGFWHGLSHSGSAQDLLLLEFPEASRLLGLQNWEQNWVRILHNLSTKYAQRMWSCVVLFIAYAFLMFVLCFFLFSCVFFCATICVFCASLLLLWLPKHNICACLIRFCFFIALSTDHLSFDRVSVIRQIFCHSTKVLSVDTIA